ncbi:MAG: hypothetical protein ACM3O8_00315 [Methylococcaceae bacterium]|nr:hypothetical protein [Prolixibacteraceae bacterium]
MIQNIIALIIVGLVLLKTLHSVYKAVTTKDKSLCGGCGSCDLKYELKKKGLLMSHAEKKASEKMNYTADTLKYSIRKS